MKNTIFITFILFLVSCGGAQKDPAAELAELKGQRTELDKRIAELEKQVNIGSGSNKKIRTVQLTEVATSNFRHFIDLQGKIEAEESVAATSKLPGAIRRVYVKNGDNVRRGQLIAELDDAVMQSSLKEMEGQLATLTDIYNRQKSLWDQKIGTEVAYIQAKNGVESLQRSMATMKENMGNTKIYAPTNGVVDNVLLKEGMAIAPGMPLCNILNLSKLKIKGDVTEAYVSKVRQGDQVQVYFPELNKEITTRVTYVSRSINPVNRTFTIECALPSGADYRANQVAVMKIVDYQNANAISIPVNLVQTSEEGEFVYVTEKTADKQGTVRKVTVQQGQNYNGFTEIKNGLKKGDWLITTGFQDVNSGETVNF